MTPLRPASSLAVLLKKLKIARVMARCSALRMPLPPSMNPKALLCSFSAASPRRPFSSAGQKANREVKPQIR